MNYTVRKQGDVWELVDAEGKVVASCDEKEGAVAELARRLAEFADEEIEESSRGARFRMTFAEGEQTVDGRVIDENATNFDRDPPLPMMMSAETTSGHEGAMLAGSIDTARRDGSSVVLEGYFDAGSEHGIEAERLVRENVLTTWSPDYGNVVVDMECVAEDDDGFCEELLVHLVEGTILGGTMVPFPALSSARIEIIGESEAPAETEGEPEAEAASVTPISAAGGPVKPPAEWFDDPGLEDTVPFTIEDSGRVYGYFALKGQCHIGVQDRCVQPPPSESEFAYFTTGALTAEGCDCDIRVGTITMDTGHADLADDHRAAAAHYDHTGTVVADVTVGEDERGFWVAGALRPDLSDEQIRKLKASALSGDWRPIGTGLELVGLLAVNVPGFPVVKSRVASGRPTALVAAGAKPLAVKQEERLDPVKSQLADIEGRLAKVERVTDAVRPLAASAIRESVSSPSS